MKLDEERLFRQVTAFLKDNKDIVRLARRTQILCRKIAEENNAKPWRSHAGGGQVGLQFDYVILQKFVWGMVLDQLAFTRTFMELEA